MRVGGGGGEDRRWRGIRGRGWVGAWIVFLGVGVRVGDGDGGC